MRDHFSYRAARKTVAKMLDHDLAGTGRKGEKDPGPGRKQKWLQRHPKLAPFHNAAFGMLHTGDRSQKPSWRAVRKMMAVLAMAPKVVLPGIGLVPYPLVQYRHLRASWRSFDRVVLSSNFMGGAYDEPAV